MLLEIKLKTRNHVYLLGVICSPGTSAARQTTTIVSCSNLFSLDLPTSCVPVSKQMDAHAEINHISNLKKLKNPKLRFILRMGLPTFLQTAGDLQGQRPCCCMVPNLMTQVFFEENAGVLELYMCVMALVPAVLTRDPQNF